MFDENNAQVPATYQHLSPEDSAKFKRVLQNKTRAWQQDMDYWVEDKEVGRGHFSYHLLSWALSWAVKWRRTLHLIFSTTCLHLYTFYAYTYIHEHHAHKSMHTHRIHHAYYCTSQISENMIFLRYNQVDFITKTINNQSYTIDSTFSCQLVYFYLIF